MTATAVTKTKARRDDPAADVLEYEMKELLKESEDGPGGNAPSDKDKRNPHFRDRL